MRINEVELRLSQIAEEMKVEGADLDALNTETDALLEERKALKEQAETRAKELKEIAEGRKGEIVMDKIIETPVVEEKRTFGVDSVEYRDAFLKNLKGVELDAQERAAITSNGNIVPTSMQNKIIDKVKDFAPVLNDVTLLSVPGYVKFTVEASTDAAADHTEGSAITAGDDAFTSVELNATEIVKMVQISESVQVMSLTSLEAFIIDNISKAIAQKIESKVFAKMNAVAAEVTGDVTFANITSLFASLKSGYARTGKIYCSRKTLYGKLIGLQDKSKNDLVVREGNSYKLLGVEISETPSLEDGVVIFADPTRVVADLAEQINVRKAYDIDTNTYKYLGVALFDVKVAIAEAVKKLAPAGE